MSMWLDFFACTALGVVVLFLPGYLVCRALYQSRVNSIAFAPLVSVGSYAGLGCVYPFLGIGCSWLTTFLPLTAIGTGALLLSMRLKGSRDRCDAEKEASAKARREWLILAGYIMCGIVFVGFIFVKNLNGADAFSVEIDNRYHYDAIRNFVISENWSSIDPSFYPSAMHAVAALIGGLFPAKVAVLSNATLTLFIAFVFPVGMFAFMRRIFPNDNAPVVFGMIVSFCFAAFPWRPLGYGPMTPFLLSLCLLPALSSAAMDLLACKVRPAERLGNLAIFCFGVLAGALMQTSVLFSLLVMMLPFVVSWVLGQTTGRLGAVSRKAKAALVVCIIGAFVGLWIVALNVPFLQGVINYRWAPLTTMPWDGLMQTFLFGQQAASEQLVLAGLVLVGFAMAAMNRRVRWTIFPYLFMAVGYFVVATFETPIEKVLAGFWYTDPIRMAANQCFFAIPLASFALGNISQHLTRRLREAPRHSNRLPLVINAGLGLAFLACVFTPYHYVPGKGIEPAAYGPGGVGNGLAWEYSTEDDRRYTAAESAFVQKVAEITGADKVLNNPYDGSCYAWGIDGVSVVYPDRRRLYDYGLGDSSVVSNLSDYATNESIRSAVRELGARYVLQLDPGKCMQDYLGDKDFEAKTKEHPYVWGGIDAIDETTPGFKLILREGNMSLYEIEDLD